MDVRDYFVLDGEKPLDRMPVDGGFTGIFRTIGCIGDSLSSGEFESTDESGTKRGYHDMFEYSWGQYMARTIGSKVYNFSKGGMTAEKYMKSFAEEKGFWNPDLLCQAYVIALGVNDILNQRKPMGDLSDICLEDYTKNKETFCGYYAAIIQRLKAMQPQARFFLVTMPRGIDETRNALSAEHRDLLHRLAEFFDYTYVIDLYEYAPVYDAEFRRHFFLGGHMNAAGYLLTAKMITSYIDYIIRSDHESFAQVGFIGKGVHNHKAKW